MFEITNCRLAGNLIGRLKRKEQLNLSCMKALLNESLSLMINLDKPLESISHIDSEINSIINIIRTSAISSENKESNIKSKMPWWNQELYGLRHQLRKVQRIFKIAPNEENLKTAREAKASYQRLNRKSKWENWKEFCTNNFNSDPFGSLRKLINHKRSMDNKISELLVDGKSITNPREILAHLGNHFFFRNLPQTCAQCNIN